MTRAQGDPTPQSSEDEMVEDLEASDVEADDTTGGRTLVLDHFVVSKGTGG